MKTDHFRDQYRPVMHVTSIPKDPLAPDFGKRINRYSAKDLPNEQEKPKETLFD